MRFTVFQLHLTMIHAFIFGTNIFISSQNTVSYANNFQKDEFLQIISFFQDCDESKKSDLIINASFSLTSGESVVIKNNQIVTGDSVVMAVEPKRVSVHQIGNGEPALDVFQLDESTYHGFGTHIVNELSARSPDATITIKANLIVAGASIWNDNEKLHVNEEIYATGVVNAHHGVILSSDGHEY
jgi:hypothetical protein